MSTTMLVVSLTSNSMHRRPCVRSFGDYNRKLNSKTFMVWFVRSFLYRSPGSSHRRMNFTWIFISHNAQTNENKWAFCSICNYNYNVWHSWIGCSRNSRMPAIAIPYSAGTYWYATATWKITTHTTPHIARNPQLILLSGKNTHTQCRISNERTALNEKNEW